jgi:ATP-dependent RNA helicase DHX37/DHR1
MSHRERLDKTDDMEVRRVMEGRSNKRRRRNNDFTVTGPGDSDSESEDAELDAMDTYVDRNPPKPIGPDEVPIVDVSTNLAVSEKSTQPLVVGGALRRNPDGTVMAPRVVKKKDKDKKVRRL